MNVVVEAAERRTSDPPREKVPADGHDLPVLAAEQNPPRLPRWESLMDDGVQPALILGAERRTSGPRNP